MANGLLDLLGGAIGTTPPAYLEGLLGQGAVEDLRKRSLGSGLVNALVGYAAMPKNQNLGLGRILAGAAQAGMQGAQGVYDTATQDYMQAQKIAEMKRQQEKQLQLEQMLGGITDPTERLFAQLSPEQYVAGKLKPRDKKTATVGSRIVDVDTGNVIYESPLEAKPRKTERVDVGNKILIVDAETGETVRQIPKGIAPSKPTTESVSYKTEQDAQGNLVYVPNKPGYAVVNAQGQPVPNYKPATATKMTEDQAKASGWLSQATNAYNNMMKATLVEGTNIPTGAESPRALEAGLSALGLEGTANLARSAPRQQFVQATKSLSEALLRAATGAGVNESEAKQKVEELTPSFTDDLLTKQQKLDAIPIYLESLRVRAGVGGQSIAPPTDKINIIPSGSSMSGAKGKTNKVVDFSNLKN